LQPSWDRALTWRFATRRITAPQISFFIVGYFRLGWARNGTNVTPDSEFVAMRRIMSLAPLAASLLGLAIAANTPFAYAASHDGSWSG
jgi:hypothetical protein